MKERIEAIIQHERLSPSQFADAIGVQRSGISHILSGRNKPSVDFLSKLLSKFPHISGDWLITGIGSMLNNDTNAITPPKQLQFPSAEQNTRKPLKVPKSPVKEESNPTYNVPKQPTTDIPAIPVTNNRKAIERIVVFYKDKTFTEYQAE